jgi:hypothetical protein
MYTAFAESRPQEITTAPWLRSRSCSSCSERLDRWVELLEQYEDGELELLTDIEHVPMPSRAALRRNQSPISVAFADPQFRAEGFAGDSYGDAYKFFGVNHGRLHGIVCYCHYRSSRISPKEVAGRVRQVAIRAQWVDRMLGRIGLQGTRMGGLVTKALV